MACMIGNMRSGIYKVAKFNYTMYKIVLHLTAHYFCKEGTPMLIDWNGNGTFDPSDLALSLAILDDERRREEEQQQDEEETSHTPAR